MKTLSLLLFTTIATAQGLYISTGLDVKNAIDGSQATRGIASVDNTITFGMVGNNNVEVTINNEYFKRINYNRFSFGVGYHIERVIPFTQKEILIIPSINYGIIDRWSDWGGGLGYKDTPSSHLGFGANISFQVKLNDKFSIRLKSEVVDRVDNRTKYGTDKKVISNFLEIVYKIKL